MVLKPVNRYVWISVPTLEENTTESGIVLPDDFKPTEERYVMLEVLDWAEDVRFSLAEGSVVIVDNSMIEEITVNNSTYSIIQDNYIVGII